MVSVITPAYNAEKHIECMILSVIRQSVQVQLIIINDGSDDSTGQICQSYRKIYPNLEHYEISNHGAGYARNYGVEKAHGDWIIFLDSDDLLAENSVNSEFIHMLEEYKEEGVDIVYTSKSKTDYYMKNSPVVSIPEEKVKFHMPYLEFWTCIYNREFLNSKNIRFFEYREQDIESAFRYRAFSNARKYIVRPDICFYLQRDCPTSNTHNFNYPKLYRIKACVYETLIKESPYETDGYMLVTELNRCVSAYFKLFSNGECRAETKKIMR